MYHLSALRYCEREIVQRVLPQHGRDQQELAMVGRGKLREQCRQ